MTDREASTEASAPGFRTFLIVWSGQLVSIVGTNLTWFGLSIWVYLETGSVTQLSLMMVAANLPRILLAPVAGALVDRWDRRWAMIISDSASGVGTLIIAIAFLTDSISIGLLVVVAAVISSFEAVHWPAYQASTSLLVPKERYAQASGMVQMADAAGQLLAPFLGGAVVALGGVAVLIAVDVVTFTVAVATLLMVRFPAAQRTAEGVAAVGTIWQESAYGFRYVWRRHPLMALLVAFAGLNLVLGFIGPVFIAYMLSFTTETTMGLVMSLGATGMLVGSVLASSFRVNSGRVARIVMAAAILGAMLVVVASSTSLIVILGALFVGMLVVPYAAAMSQSIWMAKVEPDVQGRVFSVRSMIAQITNPIALALAGPLADHVFVPFMEGDSAARAWFASITGTGAGSGYAALFVALGLASAGIAVAAWSYGPLRHLERDVPDAEGLPSESPDATPEAPDVTVTSSGIDLGTGEPAPGIDPA